MEQPRFLADSGIILRFFAEDDPQNSAIVAQVVRIFSSGSQIFFTPQFARECFAVFNRPSDVGGYALTPEEALTFLEQAHRTFSFIADTEQVYRVWLDIIRRRQISGRQVHDAYHVAAMKAHGIAKVLTLDRRDFDRYDEIEVVIVGLR